jgi:GNAT superfamily N-acetyltransferase
MSPLRIDSFTLGRVASEPACLSGYEDPRGFLAKMDARWRSLLTENPLAQPPDLALVLAVDDRRVVGRLGFYAAEAVVQGRTVRTFWTDGFFLDPAYRSTGAGGLILLRGIGACKSITAAGGPDEGAQKLYKASGFATLGPMTRYVYFYRAAPLAAKFLGPGAAARALGALATPALRAFYTIKRRRGPGALSFEPVKEFGSDLDAVLARGNFNRFAGRAATLNWCLRHRDIEPHLVRRGPGGPLVGYVLLKSHEMGGGPHALPSMRLGCILDWFLVNPSAADKADMVSFGINAFRTRGTDAFEFNFFDPELESFCRRIGMKRLGGVRAFFRPPPGASADPTGPWLLTHGAGDMILLGH